MANSTNILPALSTTLRSQTLTFLTSRFPYFHPMNSQSFRIPIPPTEPGSDYAMQMRMMRGSQNRFLPKTSKFQPRKTRRRTGAVSRNVFAQVVPEDTPEPALPAPKSAVTVRGLIVVAQNQMILRARFNNPKNADSFVAMLIANDVDGVANAMVNSDKFEYELLPRLRFDTIPEDMEM